MLSMRLKKICLALFGLCLLFIGSTFIPLSPRHFQVGNITSTRIYDRHGILLRHVLSSAQGTSSWVALDQIPLSVKQAFLTTEDKRFYSHPGVDPLAIGRAIMENIRYRNVRSGASTITQQLVRNIYHYPRNVLAKIAEAWLALRLEHTLTKEQILEQYLNRVPFGNQSFGIGAAAELYLAKPVRSLTVAEVAFLAAIPKSPTAYDPFRYFSRTLKRQKKILALMQQHGFLTAAEHQRLLSQEITLVDRTQYFKAPHFGNQIISRYLQDQQRPKEIYTTLDWHLQQNIQNFVNGRLSELAPYNAHNAAVLVLRNSTNEILVWIGSHDFFDQQYAGQVDGVSARRQPGSALKPFIYGLALAQGMTAATIIPDIETHSAEVSGYYTPKNYDEKFHGPVTLRRALACSYNVPPIRILEDIGEATFLETLQQAGFTSLDKSPRFYGKGLALGNGEVTLLELVRAYTAIANGGKLLHERFLQKITYPDNEERDFSRATDTIGVIFNQQINAILLEILSDNDARIPAFGQFNPLNFPFDCAVKTGTSKDFRDNWAIGCTPEVTVGVWVGNFNGESMHRISGVSGAGPMINDIMYFLDKYFHFSSFRLPQHLIHIKICSLSGKLPTTACPELREELFIAGTAPSESCQWHRRMKIDLRNGRLATTATEKKYIQEKIFLNLPPLYLPWMLENNLPLLNQQADSSYCQNSESSNQLRITQPQDGNIYKIDPILRAKYQQIKLTAEAPSSVREIRWLINGSVYQTVSWPFQTTWQLTTGEYMFQVLADGKFSKPVNIVVVE